MICDGFQLWILGNGCTNQAGLAHIAITPCSSDNLRVPSEDEWLVLLAVFSPTEDEWLVLLAVFSHTALFSNIGFLGSSIM
jgi:hypothetical protein